MNHQIIRDKYKEYVGSDLPLDELVLSTYLWISYTNNTSKRHIVFSYFLMQDVDAFKYIIEQNLRENKNNTKIEEYIMDIVDHLITYWLSIKKDDGAWKAFLDVYYWIHFLPERNCNLFIALIKTMNAGEFDPTNLQKLLIESKKGFYRDAQWYDDNICYPDDVSFLNETAFDYVPLIPETKYRVLWTWITTIANYGEFDPEASFRIYSKRAYKELGFIFDIKKSRDTKIKCAIKQ
jgi:hypothetical protein